MDNQNRKLKLWELGRVSNEEFKEQDKFPVILVLDNIRSLNNVGTFFRTGDAFNVQKIFLCGITAKPPHRDIHKTALGATETVEWEYAQSTVDTIHQLKSEGVRTLVLEQTEQTTMLQTLEWNGKEPVALIFGNEVDGVQQEVVDCCDEVVEIPQFGTKHSFNVSVSAGIVLWELIRKIV
ncbi:RNA methyltransferase [Wandonia haliotis]|uniref:RNA methyltransferase n=1 Tax=Wandonia haliotis TaxID=574963 RepID=A0ABP3Y581_9FLAO